MLKMVILWSYLAGIVFGLSITPLIIFLVDRYADRKEDRKKQRQQ